MRLHVVSDVHGAVDELARAGEDADALICLGDLVLFVDYDDHGQGIFADLFGADNAATLIAMRTARRFDEAREFSAGLWATLPGDRGDIIRAAIEDQYAKLFAVMPTPAYLTYGNVDIPSLWKKYLRDGMQVLDGQVASIGGRSVGFIGGGLRTPMRTPNEIDDDEFATKVAAIGSVDIICSHIPPDVPELLYDVAGRRLERGSAALTDHIVRTRPRMLLYGHVHNPLVARTRIGWTECVNVGHFRGRGTPYRVEW